MEKGPQLKIMTITPNASYSLGLNDLARTKPGTKISL